MREEDEYERELKEKFIQIRQTLREGSLLLYSLNERGKMPFEKHSEEWKNIYSEFEEKCLEFINISPYIANRVHCPKDYLTRGVMQSIIYRTLCYYNPNVSTKYYTYLTRSIISDTERAFRKANKNGVREVSYNENLDYEEAVWEDEDPYEDHGNQIEDVEKIFTIIEEKYTSSKAGQNLKKNVYTFFVLSYLLEMQQDVINEFAQKYSFINIEAVNHFKENHESEFKNGISVINKIKQKDFASFTKTRTTKYSAMRNNLAEYVKNRFRELTEAE